MGPVYSRRSKLTAAEIASIKALDSSKTAVQTTPQLPPKVSSTAEKTLLIWTKSHSHLYKKLSFTVIREICLCLCEDKRLLAFANNDVLYYNPTQGRFQPLLTLSKSEILCSPWSSYTLIDQGRIFVCGYNTFGTTNAITGTTPLGNEGFIIESDGTVHQLANMNGRRGLAGLIYNQENAAVYVFGGENWTGPGLILQSCEQYQFSSSDWKALPDMNTPRFAFNPCYHASLVYLCGGITYKVEIYDPKSNLFTPVPEFSLIDDDSPCTAVVDSECLTVISLYHIYKWSLGDKRLVVSLELPERAVWSNCTPVVKDGVVYVINWKKCKAIDLMTGATLQEVSCS